MPALGCSWTDCVLVLYRCSPTRKGSATAWLCLMLDGQRGNLFFNTYDNVNLFAVLQVNDTYLYYGNFLTRWYEKFGAAKIGSHKCGRRKLSISCSKTR